MVRAQGVFVKNPEYAGEEDEYDFYFCDERNHCIRILTPTGRVVTFAGRGNDSSDPGLQMVHYVQKLVCLSVGDCYR